MDIDRDHIDEAILALLFLGRHDGMRTWKSFDWAAMERLHTKGLISDPVGKAKSVVFTDEGLLPYQQRCALPVRFSGLKPPSLPRSSYLSLGNSRALRQARSFPIR